MGIRLVLLAAALVSIAWTGCGARPSLSPDEQKVWQSFLDKHLASGMTQPGPTDADAVAALGDKVVPYIEDNFGKAYRGPGGKGDYWLVIVLARIGTPRATEAILKVLKHDYPGKVGHDREVAASALVWLGARDAAPAVRVALADTEAKIREKTGEDPQKLASRGAYTETTALKGSLDQLEKGQGKRDTKKFPFD